MSQFNDQQALAFVQGQAHKINTRVYETRYPDWDFGRLVFVDTSGPEWAPGVVTYTSDGSGAAQFQSAGAKDIPLADVSQARQLRNFQLAAIGYQFNLEEVNTALNMNGGTLPDRRARAARAAYQKFMFDLTIKGSTEKGLGGLINYSGVTATSAPADGASSSTLWIDEDGIGQKTPTQILRDINLALSGVYLATKGVELADTLLLPFEAYVYIASTLLAAGSTETILSFVQRTNLYTLQTGQQLTIRSLPELSANGRMVAYKNSEEIVKLHLPMAHRFLPAYQDGPLNFVVPGIFRTGGIELLSDAGMRYIDGISEPAK